VFAHIGAETRKGVSSLFVHQEFFTFFFFIKTLDQLQCRWNENLTRYRFPL